MNKIHIKIILSLFLVSINTADLLSQRDVSTRITALRIILNGLKPAATATLNLGMILA